jgi:hypothetical protein
MLERKTKLKNVNYISVRENMLNSSAVQRNHYMGNSNPLKSELNKKLKLRRLNPNKISIEELIKFSRLAGQPNVKNVHKGNPKGVANLIKMFSNSKTSKGESTSNIYGGPKSFYAVGNTSENGTYSPYGPHGKSFYSIGLNSKSEPTYASTNRSATYASPNPSTIYESVYYSPNVLRQPNPMYASSGQGQSQPNISFYRPH